MAKMQDILNAAWQTLLSVGKIVLQSRGCGVIPQAPRERELVILGNGPSLNDTIVQHSDFLSERDLLAVNFAANAPVFRDLKPRYYVLTDPHFFVAFDQPNVAKLWDVFANEVDWPLALFIPTKVKLHGEWFDKLIKNANVEIIFYNMTPVEGFKWFENMAYGKGWGMPRPRNVLIPSIMLGIDMRYGTIYIAGADHSWTKTLSVDDDNNVVSIQPHFYKEEEKEQQRVRVDYMRYPLHQILYSFYVAFKSYYTISRYAQHRGIKILNITPGSFIDAFPRLKL